MSIKKIQAEIWATAKKLNPSHQQAVDYINNVKCLTPIAKLDDDHAPIGPTLRRELKVLGVLEEVDGIVVLTPPYERL